MCGIAGVLSAKPVELLDDQIEMMTSRLRHRGPDAEDYWTDPTQGIALGHCRLAVLDLSPTGAQPMFSRDKRWVISFNGEIYNFRELRDDLERRGRALNGHSDTEVFLETVSELGLQATLRRSRGMFAFSLWDQKKKRLHLVRDRFGEKPLYYAQSRGILLFASELKAIQAHPGFEEVLDPGAVTAFLTYGCVPGEISIWAGVRKVQPGAILTFKISTGPPTRKSFWSVPSELEDRKRLGEAGVKRLEELLKVTVSRSLNADVPLGVFLSGGIDSSLIAALAQAESTDDIKTFTIGYDEVAYDEAPWAEKVAEHLGTSHKTLMVRPADVYSIIGRLGEIYDEPFADASQIPTCLISKQAREHVTVALSGDGGDEFFGGYRRYLFVNRMWKGASRVPRTVRRIGLAPVGLISPENINRIGGLLTFKQSNGSGRSIEQGTFGQKVHQSLPLLIEGKSGGFHDALMRYWDSPEEVFPVTGAPSNSPYKTDLGVLIADPVEEMMMRDTLVYLPDDLLVKVDRASMAYSLEVRSPFLDPDIFDLAWSLGPTDRVHRGKGKIVLQKVLRQYVPEALWNRPKSGFGFPLDSWLRGPLQEWADGLIERLIDNKHMHFESSKIRHLWEFHSGGTGNHSGKLWTLLMFQSWYDRSFRQT